MTGPHPDRPSGPRPGRRRLPGSAEACPHLGGGLSWNDAERSWDYPLHGSCFTSEGMRIEGAATEELRRRDTAGSARTSR